MHRDWGKASTLNSTFSLVFICEVIEDIASGSILQIAPWHIVGSMLS